MYKLNKGEQITMVAMYFRAVQIKYTHVARLEEEMHLTQMYCTM
jgi:hypothetical protein